MTNRDSSKDRTAALTGQDSQDRVYRAGLTGQHCPDVRPLRLFYPVLPAAANGTGLYLHFYLNFYYLNFYLHFFQTPCTLL